jgi:hypothetical protein
MKSEKDIRKFTCDIFKIFGWFIYWNWGGLYSFKGLSDIVAFKSIPAKNILLNYDGDAEFPITLWIEFKSDIGKQTKEQKEFEINVKEYIGDYYYVIRTEDEVYALLEKYGDKILIK